MSVLSGQLLLAIISIVIYVSLDHFGAHRFLGPRNFRRSKAAVGTVRQPHRSAVPFMAAGSSVTQEPRETGISNERPLVALDAIHVGIENCPPRGLHYGRVQSPGRRILWLLLHAWRPFMRQVWHRDGQILR